MTRITQVRKAKADTPAMHAVTPGSWIDGPHTHKLVRVNGSEVARGSLQLCLAMQADQSATRAKLGALPQQLTVVEM